MNDDFDFDASDIAKTMLNAELRARHAEDWAKSRVAIANSRAVTAIIVSLMMIFFAAASATLLLMTVAKDPVPTPEVKSNVR